MVRCFATWALAASALLLLGACVSVKSTADFYFPLTTETYPPRAKDAPVPILGRAPDRPYKVIGRLAFQSDLGWKFMRESMVYNARANGADAVILKSATTRTEQRSATVPPQTDWVPMPGPVVAVKQGNNTYYQTYPTYMPVFRPAYTRQWTEQITGIDSEMIVFKSRK